MKDAMYHPLLRHYVLDESWVLDFELRPGFLTFRMDLVLADTHPDHQEPQPDQQFDYRSALLLFEDVAECSWKRIGKRPARDASGESDWGNVDVARWEGNEWYLEGDFGQLNLTAGSVRVEFLPGNAARP